jgi:GGDEF domain-containing protein
MFSRIKKLYEEYKELKYLAYHDTLTGLLNRNWFYKNINKIDVKYIYFIDINNLHEINKKGHSYGDEYIKEAISTIKHNGTLIRYAGDEFILFSDYENEVTNNKYYCVGVSEVNGNIADSINVADTNMLKSKLLKTLWFLFLLKIF